MMPSKFGKIEPGMLEKWQKQSFVDPAPNNQSWVVVKEPSLPINELLEQSSKTSESKFTLHPLPSAVWPKHSDLAPIPRHHGPYNKSKKGPKSDRLVEHNSEKSRGEVAGLLPKTLLTGATAAVTNRTVQKTSQETQSNNSPPQQGDPDGHPNSRPRGPALTQPQPHQPASSPRREPPNRRLDPEENRPGKSSLYQSGIGAATRNNSRPPVVFNRRSSSLLYQFDIMRRESDFTHDAFCMSECRKEKEEREYYCYSEFAVNGIVHDIDVLRRGIRLITLMVSSDGFYKMSRLYVTPDSFFFKVRLLVLDTYKCSKPCPDIKLGFPLDKTEEHVVNELSSLIEKGQSSFVDPAPNNQSWVVVKEPSLPINELLEQSSKTSESKFTLHPLPSAVWPKHSDLAPIPRHHGPHNKSKKGPKSDRLVEHNSEKSRGEVAGLLPKTLLTGATAAVTNRTVQKTSQETQSNNSPPQQGDPDGHPNSRPRGPALTQPQPHQPASSPRREPPNRRLDPEENRPGKSSLYQSGIGAATRNNSRPPVVFNRRSSSLLYQFDIMRRESDFTHDAFCMSECRKEKEEREYYCYTVNGIVHDIDVLRRGIRLITLMVSSDGFYKMSRLYVTPDSFFFKVRLLVLDTYKCSKPCPDIKLGTRYIMMGQIYHRRRHLPTDLLNLLGGKLKPGDGLLRSNNYVKRFNKRRHQKALEATRSRCR